MEPRLTSLVGQACCIMSVDVGEGDGVMTHAINVAGRMTARHSNVEDVRNCM